MARRTRTDPAGGWHHVMNRGARHQAIYLDDRDRRGFLGLLEDLDRSYGVETHAYCLMGNHFHLLLHCPVGNLSEGMHHLGSRYAQRFNSRHEFDGPLFRDRFASKPIDSDGYLLQASRYIHRNPLDLAPAAELVAYPWSSYAAFLGHRHPPRWLHRSTLLDLVGDSMRYRAFVESDSTSTPTDRDDQNEERRSTTIAGIEAAVAAVVDDEARRLAGNRGRRSLARNLVLLLAIEDSCVPPRDLARHFGLAAATSVWSAVDRTRSRASSDPTLAQLLRDCRAELSASGPSPTSTKGA